MVCRGRTYELAQIRELSRNDVRRSEEVKSQTKPCIEKVVANSRKRCQYAYMNDITCQYLTAKEVITLLEEIAWTGEQSSSAESVKSQRVDNAMIIW